MPTTKITPNLWFDDNALEAAEFYVSVFPNSRITTVSHYTEAGPRDEGKVLTVVYELDGQPFVNINGGPAHFSFNEATSFMIECEDQAEIDAYWEKLTADGGSEGPCGWCKDKYGLSWQVVPKGVEELVASDDKEAVNRWMKAMMKMKKLDLATLEAAVAGQVIA
jgi:predicted 3-demethylubiquinone-9 3-methyltransferase (glyoxalase superfamily)